MYTRIVHRAFFALCAAWPGERHLCVPLLVHQSEGTDIVVLLLCSFVPHRASEWAYTYSAGLFSQIIKSQSSLRAPAHHRKLLMADKAQKWSAGRTFCVLISTTGSPPWQRINSLINYQPRKHMLSSKSCERERRPLFITRGPIRRECDSSIFQLYSLLGFIFLDLRALLRISYCHSGGV